MSKLIIRAGRQAYQRIKEEGFSADMITGVVAAAGGPKWFTTYGLVRYIIADLLHNHKEPCSFLGASVGSWQMAAACTSDPGASIDRLKESYARSRYTTKEPTRLEISEICHDMIKSAIQDEIGHILDHPQRSLNIITTRGKGWLGVESDILKTIGFAGGFMANAINRRHLGLVAERIIWLTRGEIMYDTARDVLTTTQVTLTPENLIPALRASGTIPFMMAPLSNISGGPVGTYWDGGFTDYHISLPYKKGIVLHPHFLPHVLEGWMDKKLPYKRVASADYMKDVLLISPAPSFVDSLPRNQISDMKDFEYYGENQDDRISYWLTIAERSLELGKELDQLINSGDIADHMLPY